MKVLGYLAKDQAMALTLTLVTTTEPQTWKNGVQPTVVTQKTMPTMAAPVTITTTEPLTSLNKVAIMVQLTTHLMYALTRAMEKISRIA